MSDNNKNIDNILNSILNTMNITWLSNTARVYIQGQQYDKALPLLKLLLALRPHDPEPLKQMAYTYYHQGRFEDAIQCCDRYESYQSIINQNQQQTAHITEPILSLLKSLSYLKNQQSELAKKYYHQYLSEQHQL